MAIVDDAVVKITAPGAVTELVLNRPKHLNALNPDLLASLIQIFDKLGHEKELRAVIISGAGERAFAAGADISTMASLGPRAIADYVEIGQRAMRAIECCKVPVIAAVNGYALGGGMELLLACDIAIASEKAQLGQPEVALGIMPGFGGTQRLARRSGSGTARRLIYSGEKVSAAEALALGIVDKVVPAEILMDEARRLAGAIAAQAPLAVQKSKEVMRHADEQALLSGLRLEVEGFLALFGTRDREEGMRAFLEKRTATFTGV